METPLDTLTEGPENTPQPGIDTNDSLLVKIGKKTVAIIVLAILLIGLLCLVATLNLSSAHPG